MLDVKLAMCTTTKQRRNLAWSPQGMLGTQASDQFTALAGDAANVAADVGSGRGRSAGIRAAAKQRQVMPSADTGRGAKARHQVPPRTAAGSGSGNKLVADHDLPEVEEAENPDSAAADELEPGNGGTIAVSSKAVSANGDYGDELAVSRTS